MIRESKDQNRTNLTPVIETWDWKAGLIKFGNKSEKVLTIAATPSL